jgi:hypothetical protein
MVTLIRLVPILAIVLGCILVGFEANRFANGKTARKQALFPAALFILLGIIFLVVFSSAVVVKPTENAIVINTATGKAQVLGPGTYIWPFDGEVPPLMSRTVVFDMRRKIIEIGGSNVQENGVQADSNSPGRPVVYFYARGWAYPNPDTLLELYRKYGEGYMDSWVERNWISALKAVQGQQSYDYVGNNRVRMENEVEAALQLQLLSTTTTDAEGNLVPLVFVSQLAIVDFGYTPEIDALLETVAQREFERQNAELQIEVNQANQEAQSIIADTDFYTAQRESDAQYYSAQREAEAAAYAIETRYSAEAEGIRQVNEALAGSSSTYIQYMWANAWNGQYPTYLFGGTDSMVPLIQMPDPAETTDSQ